MELKEIRELIELVAEKGIADFELQKGSFKLKISLNNVETSAPIPVKPLSTRSEVKESVLETKQIPESPKTAVEKPQEKAPEPELHKIKAPIVGTFYRAPSPTSESFVKTGSKVKPGTVLCIIEAMKLMNEIESDVVGEIVEIHVENGQPVEYGQPLFSVRKA